MERVRAKWLVWQRGADWLRLQEAVQETEVEARNARALLDRLPWGLDMKALKAASHPEDLAVLLSSDD